MLVYICYYVNNYFEIYHKLIITLLKNKGFREPESLKTLVFKYYCWDGDTTSIVLQMLFTKSSSVLQPVIYIT